MAQPDTQAPVSAETQQLADEMTEALKQGMSPDELLEQAKAANDAEFRTVARMIAAGRADDPVVQAMLIEYQRAYDNPSANPASEGFRLELAQQIANKQAEIEQIQQQQVDEAKKTENPAAEMMAGLIEKGLLSDPTHVCKSEGGMLYRQNTDAKTLPQGLNNSLSV